MSPTYHIEVECRDLLHEIHLPDGG
jgi:hypothetical protein